MFNRTPCRSGRSLVFCASLAVGLAVSSPALSTPSFTLFESGHVRPLALSPDKALLFAVNTADNRLEVFRVRNSGLTHRASIPVGLEPVAVAARSNSEVWVVNHLSDSVSVVKLGAGGHSGRVVRTLLVGDEPRDIVFAGPGRSRAFITTAHRGQNTPFDPQLTTPGVGRADVWTFNASDLGASLGGDPLGIITLFSDTPRALAVTPDGSRVYAAAFHSGNRTTSVMEQGVPDGFDADPMGLPGPSTNFAGAPAPETSIILKFDGTHWVDELNRSWDDLVKFSLPDKDVFVIDATANPPAQLAGPSGYFTGVGTILYNMAVNPVSGKVYVSNTEAGNEKRFEGPGIFAGDSVRGHLHESRISVLGNGGVAPRHLNKHIDYSSCCAPLPNPENGKSLAIPLEMVVSSNGAKLYVAAFGSSKIGVYSTAALENDTFVPSTADQIPVSGGGPTGLVLDESRNRLYAFTRFDNSISIINTSTRAEIGHVPLYNPEPEGVVNGRRFLYDASFSSSHGDSSCGTCHVFGDFDSLAWDLGNPDGAELTNPGPFPFGRESQFTGEDIPAIFHPMKGPMTTQSLRGMANHGPMHWRGDRTGGNDAPTAQPDGGSFDEHAGFEKFQEAFPDLLGRHDIIPAADMESFTDFILQVTYPPNPIRALDNSLTPGQQAGRDALFSEVPSDNIAGCTGCHTLDPHANPGVDAPGFFGTNSSSVFDFQPQLMKVPHFRNAYQKVGMFGMPFLPTLFNPSDQFEHQGDQVRGFGYLHDGSIDTVFRFVNFTSFEEAGVERPGLEPSATTPEGAVLRRDIESFLLAFDSNMAPIVGQQITLTHGNAALVAPRIELLMERAEAGECDLVVKGRLASHELGFFYIGNDHFVSNRMALPLVPDHLLRLSAHLPGNELTYTCAPPGSGERIGVDRDDDGFFDGDEEDAGSDPVDPTSTP